MSGSQHRTQDPSDGLHVIHRYVFADESARLAFSPEISGNSANAVTPTEEDIGAVALQADTGAFYIIRSVSPTVWTLIAGTGGSSGYATIQDEGTPRTARTTVNFIGPAITAVDDVGNNRTNVTLSQSPTSSSVVGVGRLVSSGAGLIGGGDLSADLTLAIAAADTTITVNTDSIQVGTITHDNVAAANKDGAAATPSMRTLGTGATQACAGNDPRLSAASFDPRDIVLFDHFVSGNFDSDELGVLGWRDASGGTGASIAITGFAGRPGVVRLLAGTAAAARSCIHIGDGATTNIVFGGTNQFTFEALVAARGSVSSLVLEQHTVGFATGWTTAVLTLTAGVYFRFNPLLDTTWTLVTTTNGTTFTTRASTRVPTLTSWDRLGFVYTPAGNSIQMVINGVNEGAPITTDIPSGSLGLGLRADATTGPSAELLCDYVYVKQVTDKET